MRLDEQVELVLVDQTLFCFCYCVLEELDWNRRLDHPTSKAIKIEAVEKWMPLEGSIISIGTLWAASKALKWIELHELVDEVHHVDRHVFGEVDFTFKNLLKDDEILIAFPRHFSHHHLVYNHS